MNPCHTKLPIIHLKPAEVYVGKKPAIVVTTLGSCISVIFFNRRHRIGAICHALLPSGNDLENKFKFVDSSIFWMLDRFNSVRIKPTQLQIKLFGGSDMFEDYSDDSSTATVGQQNIRKALEIFKARDLKLTSSNVGGTWARKIFFFPHTGKILLKRIKKHVDSTSKNNGF